jgi:hypothetical protein
MSWPAAACEAANAFLENGAGLESQLVTKLSAPFITAIAPEWQSARFRILMIGQETFGWGGGRDLNDPVELLPHWLAARDVDGLARCYEHFDFGEEYRSTPLWSFHRLLADTFEGGQYRKVAWSNLVRVDTGPMKERSRSAWDNLTNGEFEAICTWQRKLFHAELAALSPDAVVFVTSWRYDPAIRFMFSDAHLTETGRGLGVHELARVRADGLPDRSFRTYHPGYLRRARRNDLVKHVVDLIRGG